jgi:transcriptional regulator with XRE-family HTH domain
MAKARRFAGITQTEMAEQLGVNPATINRWEKGASRVTRADVIAWAFLTGVELAWLEDEESSVTPPATQRYQVAA